MTSIGAAGQEKISQATVLVAGCGALGSYVAEQLTRALASHAIAGFNLYNQLTYCLPGSKNACQTALDQLILPELQHLIFERSNQRKDLHHHAH